MLRVRDSERNLQLGIWYGSGFLPSRGREETWLDDLALCELGFGRRSGMRRNILGGRAMISGTLSLDKKAPASRRGRQVVLKLLVH